MMTTKQIGRREFVKRAVLGTGVFLMAVPNSPSQAAGDTEVLLLSCMDYRLIDETERFMTRRGYRNKYDHVILAGAALGALTDKFPAWNKAFWEHLEVALELHKISKVFVVDHRDCGAYKVILGEDFSKDAAKEMAIHTEKLKEIEAQILQKYPKLKVELFLMGLNGSVTTIK
jgi:carbonic anhydrase